MYQNGTIEAIFMISLDRLSKEKGVSMRKIMVIINPTAGAGDSKTLLPVINEKFEQHDLDFDIKVSSRVGDITEIVRESEKENYNEILIVGGDGSVLEAINGIEKFEETSIGIIPCGTGNDFCKSVGIAEDYNEAIRQFISGRVKRVDLGLVNDTLFINVCSFGIDGEIIKGKEKSRLNGPLAYTVSTLKQGLVYKAQSVVMEIDDKIYEEDIMLVAIGNGKFFGGGMMILPDAEVDDEYLDVCIVRKVSNLKFTLLYPKIYKGTLNDVKEVEYLRCKKFSIKGVDKNLPINADGNLVGEMPAKIEFANKKVNIVV